ncbi:MAG: glycine oxidase [Thermoleophilaceae bacterium]|nr:glycine oxidase [Thermoleophilaceae bacterium]
MAAPRAREYDAVVVGAGIVGLASAWRAAQRGLRVLVVDRGAVGAGASSVAAGMLAPVTEADYGEEELLGLNLAGASVWAAFAAELAERSGLDTGYRESGALVVAVDRDDLEEVRRLHALQESLGLDVEWLTGRECRRLEPGLSPRVGGGVLAAHDHQADPRATLAALRAAFEHEGGEVVEGIEVIGVEESGGGVAGVVTSAGAIAAGRVVIAAGAWSAGLAPDAPPVRPVKGQILRLREPTHPDHPLSSRIIRTPRCYVVPRPSGEVVIGATVEERGFDPRVTAGGVHRLLEAAWEVLPDVEERELVETGAGFRPGTPDNAPVVGPGSLDGLIWATGHHRNGILLAPITATAVTQLLTGSDPLKTFAAFGPERFQLAGRRA